MQLSHSIHCTAVGQSLVRRGRNIFGTIVALFLAFALPATAQQTVTFTSSGTFTVPPGVTSITVHCIGGGGAGGARTSDGVAGGGGGGAYASRVLTVAAGDTFYVRVGNGGVSGSSNNNLVDGNPSWFGSSSNKRVLAVGGAGVDYDVRSGGRGGNSDYCTGTTKRSGGNGRSGNTDGYDYSGGGGGAAGQTGEGSDATNQNGANGNAPGGKGGNGRYDEDGTGYAGTNYGGGGGGAMRTGSTSRVGGNGANGVVIVTYACPSFGINGVLASSTNAGSGSTVTVTGTNLQVGTYTVIYDLASPNASSNNTATLTVNAQGTGTFTTRNLATAGSTIVTITEIISGTCTTTVNSNNTATITVCPTNWTLGTRSAQSVSAGSSAVVSLSSATLPIATYEVTYSLSGANSGTSLTAIMNVTTANQGSFTTESLANAGTTTVTITAIENTTTGCSKTFSSSNTVSVVVCPVITIQNVTVDQAMTGFGANVQVAGTGIANGTYSLTYDLTGANTTSNQSASVTFASNVGTFTTQALSNAGSTTVTIKSIISGTCTTNVNMSQSFTVVQASRATFTTPGTSTVTIPAGVTSVIAEAWGGGGSGGAATRSPSAGGGGSGGAYARKVVPVSSGNAVDLSVGSGGKGSTSTGSNGNASWFSSTNTLIAVGGVGGNTATNSSTSAPGATAPTTGSKGDITYYAGNGGTGGSGGASGGGGGSSAGILSDGTPANGVTGGIAVAGGGKGATGTTSSAKGAPGDAPGGGGAGGRTTSGSDYAGGDGGDGQVVLSWVCPTYAITTITSSRVCATGERSTITVISTANDLPAGSYTITYDLGNSKNLTATMSVSAVGNEMHGTFLTPVLNTLGQYDLTIVTLASGDVSTGVFCTSTLQSNNTVSIVYVGSQATDHFRTSQTGVWESNTTWESSGDGVNWCAATSIPGEDAQSVIVRHTLGSTTSKTVEALVIPSGITFVAPPALTIKGDLDLSGGGTLDIKGKDLTLKGSVQLSAAPGKGQHLSTTGAILGDATTTLVVNGTDVVIPTITGGVKDLDVYQTASLGSDLTVHGNLSVTNAATLNMNGKMLTLGGALNLNSNASLLAGASSGMTLTSGATPFDMPGIPGGIGTLVLNRHASLIADADVLTSLQIASGSELRIGNHTLTFSGSTMSSTGTITTGGSNTNSILHLLGSNGSIDLPAITDVAEVLINRPNGTYNMSSELVMKGDLTITSGTLQLGDHNILLRGILTMGQDGLITSGTGAVIPRKNSSNAKSKLVNAKLKRMVLDDGDADVEGTLAIAAQGTVDFTSSASGNLVLANNAVIDLGTSGALVGESNGKKVVGGNGSMITSRRTVSNNVLSPSDFGNGVRMGTSGNIGETIVERYFDAISDGSTEGMKRRIKVRFGSTPTQDVTMSIAYDANDAIEMNGISEQSMRMWLRKGTTGSWGAWQNVGGSASNGLLTATFSINTLPSFTSNGTNTQQKFLLNTPEVEGGAGGFGALPVELVSFSGMMRNEKVQLAWKTATETNNYGFEVERSVVADPKASVENAKWNTIGFVAGNGTTSSERSYSFSDEVSAGALRQVSHFAYRLRQIDRDGTTDYSPVVFVSRSAQEPVALALDMPYPNPTENESFATVRLAESRIATVQLVSLDGKVLQTIAADQQLDAGVHSFRISRGTLPAGVYFVVVQSADLRVVRPLTIVR